MKVPLPAAPAADAILMAERLKRAAGCVDDALDALLSGLSLEPRLVAAMKHGTLAGGKRVRPALVLETAALFGPPASGLVEAAAALELIHAFSLVHDDLPAMDDDALRRGQPTVHIAYDEASAILAGDGLHALAFALLSGGQTAELDPALRLDLIDALARGTLSMISGQMRDLAAEGRFATERPALTLEGVVGIQSEKTGALIAAAVDIGARIGGAGQDERRALGDYAARLGLAFQISDDLLDIAATAEEAGKATGKDAGAGKGTFVSLMGEDGATARLEEEIAAGLAALARLPAPAPFHAWLIGEMKGRRR